MDGTYLLIAEEVLQTIAYKQLYEQQFDQFEYDQLVDTANHDITDEEWIPAINKAHELLGIEKSHDYMHCKKIKIN